MPLVQGIGDEIVLGALAAAAAPIAIMLSPSFMRRRPVAILQRGFSSLSQGLRFLWLKLRLWLLRRVLRLRSRNPPQEATESSASATATLGGPSEEVEPSAPPESPPAGREASGTSAFGVGEGKAERAMSGFFGNAAPRERDGHGGDGAPVEQQSVREPSGGDGVVRPPVGEICSVCHDEFTLPCQANCGHWFCADCIIRVWHHGSALSPCRCPICRRTITLLLLAEGGNFEAAAPAPAPTLSSSPTDSSGRNSGGPAVVGLSPARRLELLQDVSKYNRLFGGAPVSLWQRVLDMPVLLRRMGRDLLDPNRALGLLHNCRFVVCVLCAGIYVLSPLDIISESLMGILGLVDDVVFLVCVAFYLTVLYRALLVSRASAAPRESNSGSG